MDATSFADFMGARWAVLYRLSYLLTGDASSAEDLLQTSLMKTYARWPIVSAMAAPEAYVRTTMINTLISTRRYRKRRAERLGEVPEQAQDSHEVSVVDRAQLWPMIRRLPPRQRAVIVLRYYEGLSEREIAQVLGCAPGTVKSHASTAMRSLRGGLISDAGSQPGRGDESCL